MRWLLLKGHSTDPVFHRGGCRPQCCFFLSFPECFKGTILGGTWVSQLVKRPTLDFSSGQDLRVLGFEPCARLCTNSVEPAWDSLSPSLCPSPAPSLVLTLSKQIKLKKKKRGTILECMRGALVESGEANSVLGRAG